jgi:hypothetical protein
MALRTQSEAFSDADGELSDMALDETPPRFSRSQIGRVCWRKMSRALGFD